MKPRIDYYTLAMKSAPKTTLRAVKQRGKVLIVEQPSAVEVPREFGKIVFPLYFSSKATQEAIVKTIRKWVEHMRKIDMVEQILDSRTALTYAMYKNRHMRMNANRRAFRLQRRAELFNELMRQRKSLLAFILWDCKEQRVLRTQRKKGREVLGIDLEWYMDRYERLPSEEKTETDPHKGLKKRMRAEAKKEAQEKRRARAAERRTNHPTDYVEYLKLVGCWDETTVAKRPRRVIARKRVLVK